MRGWVETRRTKTSRADPEARGVLPGIPGGLERLTKPDIQARIAELQVERSRRTDIKADHVLRRLIREADAGDLDEPSAARIRAIELLGKHLGMFLDRKIIGIRALPLEQLNEAELAVLAGEEA